MAGPLRLSGSVLSGFVDGKPIRCVLAGATRILRGNYWLLLAQSPDGGSIVKMIPDTGDEVLVAFSRGDLRMPYLTGGLWDGSDKPPESTYYLGDAKSSQRNIIHVSVGLENLLDGLKHAVRVTVS
jgi:hypothetical protein